MVPIAVSTFSQRDPAGLYSLIREILGVEGRDWTNVDSPNKRGWSSTGETTESSLSLSREHLVETGTSAVGEAGQDKPTLGMTDVGRTAEGLEEKYRSNIQEEEREGGGFAPWPLPCPGWEEEEEDLVDI